MRTITIEDFENWGIEHGEDFFDYNESLIPMGWVFGYIYAEDLPTYYQLNEFRQELDLDADLGIMCELASCDYADDDFDSIYQNYKGLYKVVLQHFCDIANKSERWNVPFVKALFEDED